MASKRDINLDNEPALIPVFGNVDKKPRPLNREAITIGRARGCDICLDAPDISTLHCLIYRSVDGFRVRDCGSRAGTRVNGEVPRTHVLADGDVLQVGPFTFQASIPTGAGSAFRTREALWLEHCKRSRRNLARL